MQKRKNTKRGDKANFVRECLKENKDITHAEVVEKWVAAGRAKSAAPKDGALYTERSKMFGTRRKPIKLKPGARARKLPGGKKAKLKHQIVTYLSMEEALEGLINQAVEIGNSDVAESLRDSRRRLGSTILNLK